MVQDYHDNYSAIRLHTLFPADDVHSKIAFSEYLYEITDCRCSVCFLHFFNLSLRNVVKKEIVLLRAQFLLNLDLECGFVIF